MRQVLVCALAALCFLSTSAGASADETSQSLIVGGLKRTYEIHVPAQKQGPLSLLLVFHGGKGSGAQVADVIRIDELADSNHVIVVYPDGLDKHWNDGRPETAGYADDVAFIAALISALERDYAIDNKRIFATGISNGAMFTQRLACDLSDKIAAVAPVAGLMPEALSQRCRPTQPVSVLMLQGTADRFMPVNGGAGWQGPHGGGLGGQVLSAQDSLALWGRLEGCAGMQQSTSGTVTYARYDQCSTQAGVGLYLLDGGGHTWPGSHHNVGFIFGVGNVSYALDANQVMMDFFLHHPKR